MQELQDFDAAWIKGQISARGNQEESEWYNPMRQVLSSFEAEKPGKALLIYDMTTLNSTVPLGRCRCDYIYLALQYKEKFGSGPAGSKMQMWLYLALQHRRIRFGPIRIGSKV
ncbi:uncharacterized protein LOC114932005 [Nylanderia fulva]|uniref:uncharacterized protein LOC114932005 n=1 Tax=Nylanderia fulva TaxID=613905 RepID=UPI0010FB933D|nr:uncharacterized protein LOC114932005 [Nylanderia fulva]XP_029160007.1 uncharacterized protein LOC114932005 [Nylanderia fulva]